MRTQFKVAKEGEQTWLSPEEARVVGEHYATEVSASKISLGQLAADLNTTSAELEAVIRSMPPISLKARHWSLPSKNTLIVLAFISLGVWTVHFATQAQQLRSMMFQSQRFSPQYDSGMSVKPPENFAIRLDGNANQPSLYLEGVTYNRPLSAEFLRANKSVLIDQLVAAFDYQITHDPSGNWQRLKFKIDQGDWITLVPPDGDRFYPYGISPQKDLRKALFDAWPKLTEAIKNPS